MLKYSNFLNFIIFLRVKLYVYQFTYIIILLINIYCHEEHNKCTRSCECHCSYYFFLYFIYCVFFFTINNEQYVVNVLYGVLICCFICLGLYRLCMVKSVFSGIDFAKLGCKLFDVVYFLVLR
jgi:hypothetical protein